jgi:hypothetical protein
MTTYKVSVLLVILMIIIWIKGIVCLKIVQSSIQLTTVLVLYALRVLIKLRQIPVNLGTVKNHHKINNVKTASQVTIIIQQTKYVKCKTAINLTLETINAMHVTVDTKSINKTNLVG